MPVEKFVTNFLKRFLKQIKYNKIATAHNADDNAETVLLNLIKGTGIKGIAGIPVRRNNIIRPILSLTKKEILDYLDENQFEYRIDESNLSNDFERNFLRNEVIPLIRKNINPSFSNSVLNTSLNLQSLNAGLAEIVGELKSAVKVKQNKSVSIPIEFIKKSNDFILSYTVKEIIDQNFSVKLESNDLKKIFIACKKAVGKIRGVIRKTNCSKRTEPNYNTKKIIIKKS